MQDVIDAQMELIHKVCEGQELERMEAEKKTGKTKKPKEHFSMLHRYVIVPVRPPTQAAHGWVAPHKEMLLAGGGPVQEGVRLLLRCVYVLD